MICPASVRPAQRGYVEELTDGYFMAARQIPLNARRAQTLTATLRAHIG